MKTILFWLYRLYVLIKKRTKLIIQKPITKNKLSYFLSHRYIIHAILILLTIFIATNNLKAQDRRGQELHKMNLFSAFLNQKKEEIIEENASVGHNIDSGTPGYLDPLNTPIIPPPKKAEQTVSQSVMAVLGEGTLTSPNIMPTSQSPRTRTEIEYYIIQPGDNISSIANKFGISANTVLWANNLSSRSIIRPGQKLTILPTTGLIHKVRRGDTISSIAKKYGASKENIIETNSLENASAITIGQNLIIPGGKMPPPPRLKPRPQYNLVKKILPSSGKANKGHHFPWGQCTWYVSQRRYVPWGGHAKYWISNAKRYGYTISTKPRVGAIIVLRESWYGHVAYVESVSKNKVTFAEANYLGIGVVDRRTLSTRDRRIIGYIY